MKKAILYIILIIFITMPVNAQENKLYLMEKDNTVYYESKLFTEEFFLNYTNMLPGKEFIDELLIKNTTNKTYKLYLQINPTSTTELSNELMENINIKMSLDNNAVYEGTATGKNYINENTNLQNAILIGTFSPSEESKLTVTTELSKNYTNINNTETSYVDWKLFAQEDNKAPSEIVIAPNTMTNSFPTLLVVSTILIVFGLGITIYGKITQK